MKSMEAKHPAVLKQDTACAGWYQGALPSSKSVPRAVC